MKCHDFNLVVADLARERELDAGARVLGANHAAECEACAEQLAVERRLSAGLRALSERSRETGAPPRVEAALRSAFREHAGGGAVVIAIPRRRAVRLAWAAAAAVVLTGAVTWSVSRVEPVRPAEVVAAVAPPALRVAPPAKALTQPHAEMTPVVEKDPPPSAGPRRRVDRTRVGRGAPPATDSEGQSFEVASDFYPLVSGSTADLTDGGQIVRMEVPRASLAAMGFPINVERADERVTADVVLGHDGMARAIRFVQPGIPNQRSFR